MEDWKKRMMVIIVVSNPLPVLKKMFLKIFSAPFLAVHRLNLNSRGLTSPREDPDFLNFEPDFTSTGYWSNSGSECI
jgi:hypothetical protein